MSDEAAASIDGVRKHFNFRQSLAHGLARPALVGASGAMGSSFAEPRSSTILLAGGGLANGLIAYRLAQRRPEVEVTLIEGGPRLGGRHTWSFFATDLTADQSWVDPFVVRDWDRYEVRFPARRRTITTGYRSITSERLHTVVSEALGDRVMVSSPIAALEADRVVLADGLALEGIVVDGRGPERAPDLVLGYQKFLGQTVRLTRDHALAGPIIMDATVDQGEGYRFLYVLPWDARTLLIEDTRYTDGADLDRDDLREAIGAYARSQGWTVEAVIGEEEGVLPVALDGDIEAHWRRTPRGVALSGLRAVLFHPTTGYSLPDAVALADAVCDLPSVDAASIEQLVRERSIRVWQERAFFRLLNRMLFRAGLPGERYRVLERFYGLSEPLIRRFYAARLTKFDKVRILTGKPPVPFGRALHCINEKGHA